MADPWAKAEEGRGFLSRVASKIPLFGGYLERERRREADKLLREQVAKAVDRAQGAVKGVVEDLANSGKIMALKGFDRLTNRLQELASKARYADRGYSGFFDLVKVGEKELEGLYQADLALLDGAEGLSFHAAKLAEEARAGRPQEAAAAMEKAIGELILKVDGRKDAILGLTEA